AIHATRREAQQQADNEEERKRLKGLRYILLKKDEKLTESDKKRLDELKDCHPQLYQLTRLRQQLYQWYEADYSVEEATKELNRWLEKAETIASKSLQVFCQTLRNWQQEITNFFSHRITSGFVEGMNNKIRVIKRIAFGLPSF
ncbi:transposase, partial [Arthrospira platensis SPKY1]|nr:transposase [Arthrospira platensis SPKY1]